MIKDLLISIKNTLSNIAQDLPQPSDFHAKKLIEQLIENDLAQLNLNQADFLDGPDGYVNYYSPFAKQHLKNKKAIIEKYLTNLHTLQAALFCIYKNNAKHLLTIDNIEQLANDTEVKTALAKNKAMNTAPITLRSVNDALKRDLTAQPENKLNSPKKSELEQRKKSLSGIIEQYEKETQDIPGFSKLNLKLIYLEKQLNKHNRIIAQIPNGMMDLKRALSFNESHLSLNAKIQEIEAELERDNDASQIEKLKKRLSKLKINKAALLSYQFSHSSARDAQIKEQLKDLKQLMRTSINSYQELAIAGGDINAYLQQTTGFYWENLLLFRRTVEAIHQQLPQNRDVTKLGKNLVQCIDNSLKHIPCEQTIQTALAEVKTVDANLSKRAQAHTTMVDDHSFVRFYKGMATIIIDKLMATEAENPMFFLPYSANNYVLDHPAHTDISGALGNCFGETQAFLKQINGPKPTINNICPPPDLINYQLDQSRRASKKDVCDLGQYKAQTADDFVKWSTIKELLTQEVSSEHHGDVCWLKFKGARVPDNDKDVAHTIGFIKIKKPDPYQYVIYDYNLGTMGFSNESQLQTFFEYIFEGPLSYYPYSSFQMEKIDDLRDECRLFLQGIKALQPANPEASCIRSYWNKERLLHFIKYQDGKRQTDIDLIIEQAQRLAPEAKEEVYLALLHRDNIAEGINRIPSDLNDIVQIHELVSETDSELANECQTLINQLWTLRLSSEDTQLTQYCSIQRFKLKHAQDDPVQLAALKESLSKHLQAINSQEMIAIKKELARLQTMQYSFFGFGPRDQNVIDKINAIKAAIAQVPLLERIHVFTNEESHDCNQVRITLAEHRHRFRSSALTNGKVDPNKKAARSFDNLKAQFKERIEENKVNEESGDNPLM